MNFVLRSALALVFSLGLFAQARPAPQPTTPVTYTAAQLAVGIGISAPQSLLCADPAVTSAVNFLVSLGATSPHVCVDDVEFYPGGSLIYSRLTWTNPTTGATRDFSAGITAVRPGETALSLSDAGDLFNQNGDVIKLPATFQTQTLMPYQAATMAVPTTVPLAAVPTDPVGPKVYPGTPDQIGDQYYTVPGEQYLSGQTYRDAIGHVYLKVAVPNPFGSYVYWLRVQ